MTVYKCKICGGDLEIQEGMGICECMYCGTKQTLPKINDERRANLYDRANHFRRNNEFDKAMSMYEQILEEDKEDAEAYWSLVLCTYGIEYVEDPVSHKRMLTVNRTQFTSVFADENYKAALRYADDNQRQIYEEEAKQIDEIQKGILDISNQEKPYDIFICYKETDQFGKRTPDSVLANDLYHQLTQEGFKVFFARITLEDKLGSAYEPYIFAALNSAKVMVVIGTKAEYFNAVWVKNEWSRYLSLIKNGAKKVLIPAYKDMDPYDMPQEFSHLQSQDMSKLGFMQDLLRGIKKLTDTDRPIQTDTETSGTSRDAGTEALLKRVFLFLEDGNFARADEFCEKVLNIDPENGEAYLGKMLAGLQIRKRENLGDSQRRLDQFDDFAKMMRFGNEALKAEVNGYNQKIIERQEQEAERRRQLQEQEAERMRQLKEQTYQNAVAKIQQAKKSAELRWALNQLKVISTYKDAAVHIKAAETKLEQKLRKKIMLTTVTVVSVIVVITLVRIFYNNYMYAKAQELIQEGEYKEAYNVFGKITDDTTERDAVWTDEMLGVVLDKFKNEEYKTGMEIFEYTKNQIADIKESLYIVIEQSIENSEWEKADQFLELLNDNVFEDNTEPEVRFLENVYNLAVGYVGENEYIRAYELFASLNGYRDSGKIMADINIKVLQQRLQAAEKGDIVSFGRYKQDNNMGTGTEEIEWIVLERSGNECLLLSRYILDAVHEHYSVDPEDACWENSDVRIWMNSTFYEKAFDDTEREIILLNNIKNEKIIRDDFEFDDSVRETEDKVFALSLSEVGEYIDGGIWNGTHKGANFSRIDVENEVGFKSESTMYARWKEDIMMGVMGEVLRTMIDTDEPVLVRADKKTYSGGLLGWDVYSISSHDYVTGVRPAIWINMDAATK